MQPPWTKIVDYSTKPIFVCWETTKSCLLSCRHCRATAIRNSLPGELDHETGLRLIDQLLEFGEPYPALLLTGGDPLMRPDVFDLLRHAKDKGIYTAVAASVTPLLTREKLELMRDLGVEIISVSMDGASAEIHDKIRDIPGTWQATLDAIEVFFLIRTGRGSSLENPEPWECEEVAHFLYDTTRYGIPVRTSEGPHFRRVYLERQKGGPAPTGELYTHLSRRLRELEGEPKTTPSLRINATGDGKGIIFIGHDGEVHPSGFLPLPLGNVKETTLRTIYTTHPLLVGIRNPANLKGRCGACEHKVICGGSRSRAYAEFEDPYQEDPACPYVPAGARIQKAAASV